VAGGGQGLYLNIKEDQMQGLRLKHVVNQPGSVERDHAWILRGEYVSNLHLAVNFDLMLYVVVPGQRIDFAHIISLGKNHNTII